MSVKTDNWCNFLHATLQCLKNIMKFFELPHPPPSENVRISGFLTFPGGIEMKDWGAVDSKEGIHDS